MVGVSRQVGRPEGCSPIVSPSSGGWYKTHVLWDTTQRKSRRRAISIPYHNLKTWRHVYISPPPPAPLQELPSRKPHAGGCHRGGSGCESAGGVGMWACCQKQTLECYIESRISNIEHRISDVREAQDGSCVECGHWNITEARTWSCLAHPRCCREGDSPPPLLPLSPPTPHPQVITEDLETLISKVVKPANADYAVITGVQIHSGNQVPNTISYPTTYSRFRVPIRIDV